eukprot:CAMPEP_0118701162 /NCGR_PEP_ID=MMETSP0800-20121206/17077_1 /TAXON_ID=210618 ORGANISM="Striatella unipunctata, Strain CCMP2910" /NCGR_SAMPLE_ID=MMETSP0800 /ASSEMBLY_ACC=CAM_ASM_000638 /LENGTH=53 /DNA_ID=CAMNT_0006602011 /DNA_START=941 /DNA_END=1102 /DNA_ORIENTATION=+
MSLDSLTPKFKDMKICTDEELERATQSMVDFEEAKLQEENFQVFSLPSGMIFQ